MMSSQRACVVRAVKQDHWAVLLSDTNAVVCVRWACKDQASGRQLMNASYKKPVEVLVTLGEYDVKSGVFQSDLVVLDFPLAETSQKTVYRRIMA